MRPRPPPFFHRPTFPGVALRAVILSHLAADPSHRSRYHALASLGCQIWLAVPHRWHPVHRTEPFVNQSRDDGRLHVVPVHVRGSLPGDVPARWNTRTIARLLRDVRPDIVQIEEEPRTQVAAVTTVLARRLGLATVILTGTTPAQRGSIMQRRYARQSLTGASGVIAVNGVVADRVRGTTPAPTALIPAEGATPPLAVSAATSEAFVIGFAGRLVPERGLDVLFQACVQVHGSWQLTVVGSGPEQEALERLAERLGIAARINWAGGRPRSEWGDIWPTLDCLALPSRTTSEWYDPGGIHLLEAMAFGVPVVASDSGVLREIVGSGGVIIPQEDSGALSTILRDLQHDPDRRHTLSEAARRRVLQDFTSDALARKTRAFWQRVAVFPDAATP